MTATAATATLGDVASFIRGITFKPDDVVPLDTPGSVLCMRTKNVQQELDLSDVWAVDSKLVKRREQFLQAGDILVSSANSWNLVGKCCWVPDLPAASSFGGFISVLRADTTRIDARYLYHWFSSPRTQTTVRSFGQKTTNISNLNFERCLKLTVPLPPLEEQRRIAEVLDRADELRAKRREALAHLDDLTQSIFLDMFGDPATNPKAWPIAELSTLFHEPPIYGTMVPATEDDGSWLCLRVANIQGWDLDLSDRKYVDLDGRALERHAVKNGDILLARAIASQEHLGKAVVARPGREQWAFDSHLMRLSFDARRAEPEYIRALLRSPGGRSLFLRVTRRSSVQYNINTKEISRLRIPVPPVARQEEFAARVQEVEEVRAAQRVSLAELDALFASLQDRAFRGLL